VAGPEGLLTDVESKSRRPPEWAELARASEFEPLPRIGVLAAVRRYWLLALLPVIASVAVVGVVAAKRSPKYSAEARLIVGRLNVSTPAAISGYAQAATDLASTYPLVIDADGVVGPVARQLHMSKAAVRSALTATSVPGSSIVRIDTTASSARRAIDLANAASGALVSYLTNLNRNDPDAARLLHELSAANLAYEHAAAQVPPPTGRPLDATGQRLKANAATARAEVSGLTSAYQQTVLNGAVSSILQPVSSASSATSDKKSKLEIALLAALIGGAILGAGLATLHANTVARRALTAPSWQPADAAVGGNGEPSDKPSPVRSTSRWRSGWGSSDKP
jgi:uncharacterized protein involved in exopolysaccharide biosynthesis